MGIEIKVENIKNPPEKVRLMYEAVSQLLKGDRELSSIKVQDITQKAGIGKGTAYEYFSSKEEIIANALMFEYANKIALLVESAFKEKDFKKRCYKIMDWLCDNKDYNMMFKHLFRMNAGLPAEPPMEKLEECEPGNFGYEAYQYVCQIIDEFMEDGYAQGAFTETDKRKRCLAILTAMIQYAVLITCQIGAHYEIMSDKEMREAVYTNMIKSLN